MDNYKKTNKKLKSLSHDRVSHKDGFLSTNQGVGVSNTDDTLKAGSRGPSLLQDFIFREKITHFDHERIPERVVHARGFGAHGYFQVYKSLSNITCAHFLSDPELVTPVFVRFSTVAGFRGSPDTVRDVRGFAVKFYTEEGNYDLVGNNMPVFFIQDAIKFPDLIHALKPEPQNEMPQAASAHDTFWDFVANTPETMHNVMWLMSDRAIPKSYRTMEGFGIHTFKFVNDKGDFKFVKFHWKPLLGVHSLVWDEAQKIAGKDPDFNRRDLWDNLNAGTPAEWELAVQILDPADEFKFDFDILDCTKLWPEELIPLHPIGKMTLNRNVTNFFAETEQVAFCPANIVPGLDFSNDPMLQGRLFSYLDTQLTRLGGPNFQQLPINRPLSRVNNNQRDGMHRMTVDEGQTSYSPNSLNGGQPHPVSSGEHSFNHLSEKVDGHIIRERSKSFSDFYTQPAMFWNSMSDYEKKHIIDAFRFELGKCLNKNTRQSVVNMLGNVSYELAKEVAEGLGAAPPSKKAKKITLSSPALSMANTPKSPITKKVAVIIRDGFDKTQFDAVTSAVTRSGACFETVSCALGTVKSDDGSSAAAAKTFLTAASVLYDAVFIPGGGHIESLKHSGDAIHFIEEAYRHFKTVGLSGNASELLTVSKISCVQSDSCAMAGVVLSGSSENYGQFASEFITALTEGRHFKRAEAVMSVPA